MTEKQDIVLVILSILFSPIILGGATYLWDIIFTRSHAIAYKNAKAVTKVFWVVLIVGYLIVLLT